MFYKDHRYMYVYVCIVFEDSTEYRVECLMLCFVQNCMSKIFFKCKIIVNYKQKQFTYFLFVIWYKSQSTIV